MAVTLLSTPDLFALTRGGRMVYQFQGTGQQATLGTPAQSFINFSGPVPAGTVIRLKWNGTEHPIVARTNPTEANEFPAGDGSSAYVDSLLEFFQSYFPFYEDFIAERLDFINLHQILLAAKQPGPQFNISAPAVSNAIEVVVGTPGADPIVREQYGVYAEIWVKRPGESSYTRIFAPTIACDAEGIATMDVGKILHGQLGPDWPTWSYNQPTGSTRSQLSYYVTYAESFGQPQQVGKIQKDDVRQAYFGGVDYQHQAGQGFELASYVVRQPDAGSDRALRLGSFTRYVRSNEPQFLTFLNTRADRADVHLLVELTFADNSKFYYNTRYAPQTWPKGSKITYAVGPAQLNIADQLNDGDTVVEYSVWLANTDSTAYYSQKYRFILVSSYEPFTRYFAYLNSLGAVDTVTTFGKGSYELTRFYEQANQYLPAHYNAELGQFVQYDVSLQQQIEVATGYRTFTELMGWNDVYRSAYLFHMQATKALPIAIVSKSIKQGKDQDNLYAHTFQFVYRWQESFFSEEQDPELIGEPAPPLNTPTGPVTIEQPTVIDSVDHTVPDVVRGITDQKVGNWNQAYAWGNHALQGYLKQDTASQLFYRKDSKIDYQADLINKPFSRDSAGLTDVLTIDETGDLALLNAFTQIKKLVGFRPVARSWTGDDEPQ
ncbi:hypothetical protein G8759_25220 [Spirosoma aureum]|uniref:Uncharacterized protein n=1 Tax=Spirosoma aureum TaxID=2692134 RepID=A0A6G9ATI5_9BACT|nr:hypothetical protein [Spirosoma aureum]QIP15698.1 hypothetical protein G8759_25220 [Spirosoma aureum]